MHTLTKGCQPCLDCSRCIRLAVHWLEQIGCNTQTQVKCLGNLRVRMVMWVHKKKVKGRKDFESILDICKEFVKEVHLAEPHMATLAKAP